MNKLNILTWFVATGFGSLGVSVKRNQATFNGYKLTNSTLDQSKLTIGAKKCFKFRKNLKYS